MNTAIPRQSDVVIIGGGINGLLTAYALSRAGQNVLLLEQAQLGREASWAGGGIVSPLYPWRYSEPVTALATVARQRYPALCAQLLAETGIDPEYSACGLLMLDAEDERDACVWAARHGQDLQRCDAQALQQNWPGLDAGWRQGVWMPQIANVRNPRLLKALIRACQLCGVQLQEQAEVTALSVQGRAWQLTLSNDQRVQAGAVVVCAGAWSRRLLSRVAGVTVPQVRPLQGQMLLYRRPPGELPCIVMGGGRYVIPRRDGHILCGSTLEETGFEKHITTAARDSLQVSAERLWPALCGEQPLQQWAGLRPATANGIPYIGPVPGAENLWINAGQFRNGLVLAPASADLLVDLMLQRPPCLDPRPYQLLVD